MSAATDVASVVAVWRARMSMLPGGVLVMLGLVERVDALADAARAMVTAPWQLRVAGEVLVTAGHVEAMRRPDHVPPVMAYVQIMAGLRLIDEAFAAATAGLDST